MTVSPGFGGQRFITSQLDKVKRLQQTLTEHHVKFQSPWMGEYNLDTAQLAVAAGQRYWWRGRAYSTYGFSGSKYDRHYEHQSRNSKEESENGIRHSRFG